MSTESTQLYRCLHCKASSTYKAAYLKARSWKHGLHYRCYTCEAYRKRHAGLYIPVLFGGVCLLVYTLFITNGRWDAALQYLFFFYPMAYVSIFLHEVGHALASKATGLTMHTFSIGGGGKEKVFRLAGYFVILSPMPTEGHITFTPSSRQHYRKKMAVVTLAGPLTNLLIAGATFSLADSVPDYAVRMLVFFTAINLWMAVSNLWPFYRASQSGAVMQSDGAQLLGLRALGDEAIDELVRARPWVLAHLEFLWGDRKKALDLVKEVDTESLSVEQKVSLTAFLLEQDHVKSAIALCQQTLLEPDLEPLLRTTLQNNLASAFLMTTDGEYSRRADVFSASAMTVLPMQLEVRMTRASVLVAKKQFRKALALLQDKRLVLLSKQVRATAKTVETRAWMGLDKPAKAQATLREAQELDPANTDIADALKRYPQLSAA